MSSRTHYTRHRLRIHNTHIGSVLTSLPASHFSSITSTGEGLVGVRRVKPLGVPSGWMYEPV